VTAVTTRYEAVYGDLFLREARTWRAPPDVGTDGDLAALPARVIDSGAMVVWTSGWGDGAYPTWIGYAEGGAVTCFVADMLLFPTGEDDEDDWRS
jgi:hypothetical protein